VTARVALIVIAAISVSAASRAGAGEADPKREIAAAVLPLPVPMRAAAGVVRLDSAFNPQVLRRGTNGMVCIADRPGDALFDVRCYRDSFIQVVYRAFQLRYGGGKGDSAGEKIDAEIKAAKISLPRQPTAGYRCLGPIADFDSVRITLGARIYCWQSIHFPYRTALEIGLLEESQLSDSAKRHTPYVMASGTYWSHVMIEHP
jgi:hypothetical protein